MENVMEKDVTNLEKVERITSEEIDYSFIKASSKTNPKALASLIQSGLEKKKDVVVFAVGPNAVNQVQKAIAICSSSQAVIGYDIYSRPFFYVMKMDKTKDEKTALGFKIIRIPTNMKFDN